VWPEVAWRLFWRELKRGELWVIAFALCLAVFTVVSLSGITESVRSALAQRSANFIAADKILRSSLPFKDAIFEKAETLNLKTARQMQFSTMVFAGDEMQLVSVKAVSASYPLRGVLTLRQNAAADAPIIAEFKPGEVYLEPRLLQLLHIKAGDSIEVGASQLKVAGVIAEEPDAPLSVFGTSPRLLMHVDDVAATEVVQPGSRISYRYQFAGTETELAQLESEVKPYLTLQDRWQKLDRESAIGSALDRAEKFLLLAGLLGIVLAACAAAVAASQFSQRHAMSVAVIKALGVTTATARKIFASHLALVTLLSVSVGLALGQLASSSAQWAIVNWLGEYQAEFSSRPLWLGLLTAVICAGLFSARPIWRLAAVPALNVLRQRQQEWQFDIWHLATGSIAVWLLMWLFSGDLWLSGWLFALCVVFASLLLGLAALLVKVAKPMAAGQSSELRLALANLRRRLWPNSFQLITFSLALFLTLLLYFLRAELIGQWQQQVPQGAANQFLINITEVEKSQITALLAKNSLTVGNYYPMISGRVLSVNEQVLTDPDAENSAGEGRGSAERNKGEQQADQALATNASDSNEQPARRAGIGRELNLTWLSEMPANNEVVKGQWFVEGNTAEVSVEVELAKRLDLAIGDIIGFSVGGQQFSAKVSSFRKVNWNSLQPNFFMILSPDVMATFPATYLTAFYLPAEQQPLLNQLARQFPTVSVLSVDNILKQINDIIAQVSLALTVILALVFAAAVLVLVAQVQATLEQRQQEIAILRTLGAKTVFLRKAVLAEFAVLGLLAGIFATVLAEVLLGILQVRLFQLPFSLHWNLWWIGPGLGMCLITGLGFLLLRKLLILDAPTLLRRALQ
jgi:putative ABC transport system permease protein